MSQPLLREGDGFNKQNPGYRDEVKTLQQLLADNGQDVSVDGYFGAGTTQAVKNFQRSRGLDADGLVGPNTWEALEQKGQSKPQPTVTEQDEVNEDSPLEGFHGDLAWVHAREGYGFKAYWPGGASGVTLDPGMDVGHAKFSLIEKLYKDILSPEQLEACRKVSGIKGQDANQALANSEVLKSIRISKDQSDEVFPYAAVPYWNDICKVFPTLKEPDILPQLQTVMLSLAYNRGPYNKGLRVLKDPIQAKDYKRVGELVAGMQQDHKLEGIRKRRRMEGELILDNLPG